MITKKKNWERRQEMREKGKQKVDKNKGERKIKPQRGVKKKSQCISQRE